MNSLEILNLSIGVSSVILSILSIIQVFAGARIDRRTKTYFIAFCFCMILFSASNLTGQLLRGRPGASVHTVLLVSNTLEFLFAGVLACVGGRYLLSMSDPEKKHRAAHVILYVLFAVHVCLLLMSQFTGLLYTIDTQNIYHRSAFYALSLAAPAGMILLSAVVLFQNRKRLNRKQQTAFTCFVAIPLTALFFQAFIYGVNLVVMAAVVSLFVMFIFLVSDQTERYYRQQEENANLKVNLMLSQIQPHFLYNTLGTIRELCYTEPNTAAQAVGSFVGFLRHNMNSINTDQPIPFRQELEHVQSYLSLQKLRFGDDVQIEYDLGCMDFFLPTLTLQPLVENAVTHGVRETESGHGTVTIRSREYPDRYELCVIDNGKGFDPEALEQSPNHIGILNVRQRLEQICQGQLVFESGPDKGTRVSIILPKGDTSC